MKVYRSRIMFIGQDGAGKTSLKKYLLGLPFNPQEKSTEGIELDLSKFEVDVDHVKNWQRTKQKDLDVRDFYENIGVMIAAALMDQNSLSEQVITIINFQSFQVSFKVQLTPYFFPLMKSASFPNHFNSGKISPLMSKKKKICQMFLYSGHALSYSKLVHRHATQTEGNKYFK